MKIYKIFLTFLLLISMLQVPASADPVSQDWHQGTIYLEDEIIKGEIKFDHQLGVVYLKEDEVTQVFTAHTADSFKYYDKEAGLTRTFSSLNPENKASRGKNEFYEVVLDGDLTLLRKAKFAKFAFSRKIFPLPPLVLMTKRAEGELIYEYYLQGDNGLTEIKYFKRQVLPLMADRKEEMNKFISSHRFNMYKPTTYILLVNYYNHLKDQLLSRNDQ